MTRHYNVLQYSTLSKNISYIKGSTYCRQIEEDCKFLESEQIMDYSLLLGLHIRAPPQKQYTNRRLSHEGHNCTNEEASVYDGKEDATLRSFQINSIYVCAKLSDTLMLTHVHTCTNLYTHARIRTAI